MSNKRKGTSVKEKHTIDNYVINEYKEATAREVLTVADIKKYRKEFGYTQQDLADNFCVSKSMIGQIESGKKPLTDNYKAKLTDFFTLLAKQKLKADMERTEKNVSMRQAYLDGLVEKEHKKEIINNISEIRKAKDFTPSIDNVSCDMIWMQSVLVGTEKKVFEDTYIHTEIRTDIEYYPKRSYQRPNIDFSYMFTIHCLDGKITVGYGIKGNNGKEIPKLVVQFNPNKVNMEYNTDFHMLAYCLGKDPIVTKIDYCRDYVGVVANHIIVSDMQRRRGYRKEESNGVTHYVGNINTNGIRVYDKRAELLKKDRKVINYDVTRYEHRRQICRALEVIDFNSLDDLPKKKDANGEDIENMKIRYVKDVKLSEMNDNLGFTNLPVLSAYSREAFDSIDKDTISIMHYYTAKAIFEGHDTLANCKKTLSEKDYNMVYSYFQQCSVVNMVISEADMKRCNNMMWHRYNSIYEEVKKNVDTLIQHHWLIVKDLKDSEGRKVGSVVDGTLYNGLNDGTMTVSEIVQDLMDEEFGTIEVDEEQMEMYF